MLDADLLPLGVTFLRAGIAAAAMAGVLLLVGTSGLSAVQIVVGAAARATVRRARRG